MKCLSTFAITATLLSWFTEAIQLDKRTDGPARVVGLSVTRNLIRDPIRRDRLRKRSTTVQATLDNEVTCRIGSEKTKC